VNRSAIDKLEDILADGEQAHDDRSVELWSARVIAFLRSALGQDYAREFENITDDDEFSQHSYRLGHVQGIIAKLESEIAAAQSIVTAGINPPSSSTINSRKIFVVHGHDNEAKESVARFLEKLGLEPIILHEQPSSGRTIIEKFETYSGDIAFAVVLLTPDDLCVDGSSPDNPRPRARQNVIMELGYFLGRLGRVRVCALYKGDVELPSDYQGVLYIDMDLAGAWKAKLAQEFVEAKLPINLSGLLAG
jgi:predicted nucleotide-binding protein